MRHLNMYSILDAHFLSIVIVVGSIMATPIYVMAAYVFSGASAKKGFQIGCAFLVWGAFMFGVCLADMPRNLGLPGNLIVPAAWFLPSLILI